MTKLDASGAALVYSTYLGGSGGDYGYGIALDGAGSAYVTGRTDSADFPTTPGAFDTTFNGGAADAFVTKLTRAAPPSSTPPTWAEAATTTATASRSTAPAAPT